MTKDKKALIVLAAGKGTRLGMAGQPNKALVPVRQSPAYAHQLAAAVEAGVTDVIFVVPDANGTTPLQQSVHRSFGALLSLHWVERPADGPGHATQEGIEEAVVLGFTSVHVIMSDTMMDHDELVRLLKTSGTWAGAMKVPAKSRLWCVYDYSENRWLEHVPGVDEHAFVGLASLPCSVFGLEEDVLEMGTLLTEHHAVPMPVESWYDVGDVRALQVAHRKRLSGRGEHHLRLDYHGWMTKDGAGDAEYEAARELGVMGYGPEVRQRSDMQYDYQMRYVDSPSLAELWMFDTLPDSEWMAIIDDVVRELDAMGNLSPTSTTEQWPKLTRQMLTGKLTERFKQWRHRVGADESVHINAKRYRAGAPLIDQLTNAVDAIVQSSRDRIQLVHGDPNFTNLLYSVKTGVVTMIDPRGKWGECQTMHGDRAYDAAKLRYSYHDHFAAITRDAFKLTGAEGSYWLEFGGPSADQPGIDAKVVKHSGLRPQQLELVQACILLSAMPLHPERQAVALYLQGVMRANSALGNR